MMLIVIALSDGMSCLESARNFLRAEMFAGIEQGAHEQNEIRESPVERL